MTESTPRSERRAATAARILDAARAEFAQSGERATVRGIARRAGVDPSLVLQHYGSKGRLFALAVEPVDRVTGDHVAEHLRTVLDARLGELPDATRALVRSMLTSEQAAELMRSYLQERVDALAQASPGADAELRAAVVVSSILGLTIARHFLELPALRGAAGDDASREHVADLVEPWLAALVDGR